MTRTNLKRGKLRRWTEIVLLMAGIAGVSIWIAANAATVVSQDWSNWVFDRELRGRTTSARDYLLDRSEAILGDISAEWKLWRPHRRETRNNAVEVGPITGKSTVVAHPKVHDLIGRIEIPRLGLKTIVREGAGESTLSIAAGHIPSTVLPGQPGNIAVAGHRDTLFRELKGIQNGDLVQFETLHGSYAYRVESTQVVSPTDVAVLKSGPYSQLTLVTCYPFTFIGSAPERFVVKARQIQMDLPKSDLSEANAASQPRTAASSGTAEIAPFKTNGEAPGDSASTRDKVTFSIPNDHSRQLAPGISMGVSAVDPEDKLVNGWLWVMPDRRTIWIDHQSLRDPLVFYQDGKIRELILTKVGSSSASGYLLISSSDTND